MDLLNDCETSSVTTSATIETIRLKHAVLSLQQILPLGPGGSELKRALKHFTLLTIGWRVSDGSARTPSVVLGVASLDSLTVRFLI